MDRGEGISPPATEPGVLPSFPHPIVCYTPGFSRCQWKYIFNIYVFDAPEKSKASTALTLLAVLTTERKPFGLNSQSVWEVEGSVDLLIVSATMFARRRRAAT